MEYENLGSEVVSHEKFWEEISFVRPKKRYYCPSCDSSRRKLVNKFEYLSHTHKKGIVLNFEMPICETCFVLSVHSQTVMDFYDSLKKTI
jgi:hypothetical protein